MKKKLSFVFAVIMIFTCLLTGCNREDEGMVGSVGMDGYELVECDPREDELEVYVDKTKLGTFTLVKSGDGWTLRKADNTYLSYSLRSKAITYDFDPFTWYYDGTGLYCYIQGNNNKLYIQKGGKSIGIAKVSVKFKNWVYEGTDAPKGTVAEVITPNGTEYYDSFFEAWDMVNENTNVPVTIKLHQYLNGNTEYEAITPAARSNDAPLIIDLGGHIIDRKLYGATANGSVFCLNKPGNITIKNGTVTGGYTDAKGGGFYIDSTGLKVTLEDLVIKNNDAVEAGGGIYVSENTETLTLNNVTVISNYCTNGNSAGIAWNCSGTKYAPLTVTGSVIISGNSANVGASNLSMIGDFVLRELNVEGLSEGSSIGANYPDNQTGTFTKELSNAETVKNYFSSDNDFYTVKTENNRIKIGPSSDTAKAGVCYNGNWEFFDTFSEAWGRANDEAYSDGDCMVMLYDDWIAENESLGSGYFFEGGALQPRERIDDDSWLIVDLNNHTIDRGLYNPDKGIDTPRENGCVFYIGSGSDQVNIIIQNGTITGGNNSGDGGAFFIKADSSKRTNPGPCSVYLKNVKIKNNRCNGDGGAVLNNGTAVLKIIDTEITNNHSNGICGGVHTAGMNTKLIGKVIITGNTGKNNTNNMYCYSNGIDGEDLDFGNSMIGISRQDDNSVVLVYIGKNHDTCLDGFFSDTGKYLYIVGDYIYDK